MLAFRPPPRMYCKNDTEHQECEHIANFLSNQLWHLAVDQKDKGVSWTELMVLYEITGCRWSQTVEGQRKHLAEQLLSNNLAVRRWKVFLSSKGNMLKKTPYRAEAAATTKEERTLFKGRVRKVIQYTPDDLTKIAFAASRCPEVHRFRGLNVIGHEACCRVRPVLEPHVQQQLTLHMLQLKADMNKNILEAARAYMHQPSGTPPVLQRKRLALGKAPPWRKGKIGHQNRH